MIVFLVGAALWTALPRQAWADANAQTEPQPEEELVITGKLVDPLGQGVHRAEVIVIDQDAEHEIGEAESHVDGTYAVQLEALEGEQLVVHFVHPHFEEVELSISPEDVAELRATGSLALPEIEMERRVTAGFFVATLTFLGVLALIATEKLHKTVAALAGMTVIFFVSYIATPVEGTLFILDFETALLYIDFEVIFLIMGMMIVVFILEETGILNWLAYQAYRISRGRIWMLAIVLMLLTAVASALLDNVTTMLLMVPITLQIALALDLNPLSLLMPEVLAANVGGIATLIGTPTNILIGSFAGLSFNDFVVNLTPGVILAMIGLILYVQFIYRKEYRSVDSTLSPALSAKLAENAQITQPVELRKAGIVFAGMLVLFVLGGPLNLLPAVTALIGSTALLIWIRPDVDEIIRAVDWTTLLFFIGLFVVVGGIQEVGLISLIAVVVGDLVGDNLTLAVVLIVYLAAFISMVVDNIPFAAAMLPVVGYLTLTIPGAQNDVLFYTLSVGAAMGGNGSLIGASPNLVTAGIAERAGYRITYTGFMRVGLPSMLLTVTLGLIWLLIRF
jgi:Na+/H+ antiporter NhaD/arsenite permease-like protein